MINKIKATILLIAMTCSYGNVYSAQQAYEEMKDETRQTLSKFVSDVAPEVSSFSSYEEELNWIKKQSDILKPYIQNDIEREQILKSIHYEATRSGLEPELILGLIEVESLFKKYAISSVNAFGLMQVMPFWVDVIGTGGHNLFHIRTNLRYGTVILKHYLDIEKGNMARALGRYNGSLGKEKYPLKVQNAANKYRKANKEVLDNLVKTKLQRSN